MKAYKGGKPTGNGDKNDPNLLRVIEEHQKQGHKAKVNDSGTKYSAMLLDLIKPFHSPLPGIDEIEDLLELAVIAWNIATIKKEVGYAGNVMLEETREEFKHNKEGFKIIEKLVKAKAKKYSGEDMLIREFRVGQENGGAFVVVTAMPFAQFMEETMSDNETEDEDWDDEKNFAPGYINRNGFSLVAKQPFIDWIHRLEGNSLFPLELAESAVYLLEEKNSNEEVATWLEKNFDRVFRLQLEAWFVEESKWPKNRTYQLFNEWFGINYHSMVYDLEDFPVDISGD